MTTSDGSGHIIGPSFDAHEARAAAQASAVANVLLTVPIRSVDLRGTRVAAVSEVAPQRGSQRSHVKDHRVILAAVPDG